MKKARKGLKEEREDRRDRRVFGRDEVKENSATRTGVYVFTVVVFVLAFAVVFAATFAWLSMATVLAAALVACVAAMSVRIAPQWERVAVLRLGRFNRICGPGPYLLIPFMEYATIHIDQRIITDAFSAEDALTADLVPVNVDAVLFWMVWDPKKACLEVENYPKAVLWSAQTALRDAIGQIDLAELSLRRKQVDHELQETLGSKCEQWGITITSVEIRDITIPPELQDALSREAQAQKERDARMILAEVEKDISEMFVEAAEVYDRNDKAMQLRAMNLAYEGTKEGKGILLAPTSLADAFDVGNFFKK